MLTADGPTAAELKVVNGSLQVVSQRTLFQTKISTFNDTHDVSPDGKRFLVDTIRPRRPRSPLSLVMNWTAEFEKMKHSRQACVAATPKQPITRSNSRLQTHCSAKPLGRITLLPWQWPHSALRFEPPCDNSRIVGYTEVTARKPAGRSTSSPTCLS